MPHVSADDSLNESSIDWVNTTRASNIQELFYWVHLSVISSTE